MTWFMICPYYYYLLLFQHPLLWDNGAPVAFQQFLNTNYRRKPGAYFCFCSNNYIQKADKSCEYPYCPNLTTIKSSASSIIHPLLRRTEQCTMMLLTNLAEPDWIFVPCDEPYLYIVVCKKEQPAKKKQDHNIINLDDDVKCHPLSIVVNHKCFTLNWKNVSELQHLIHCSKCATNPIIPNIYTRFYHIFDIMLTEDNVSIIILRKVSNSFHILNMYRYLDVIVYKHTFISKAVEGIYLAKVQKLKLSLENVLFQCTKGVYILIDYVCDLSIDCPNDKSDEQNCTCQNMFESNYCKEIEVQKSRKQCSHLYYTSLSGTCHKYSLMADFPNPL